MSAGELPLPSFYDPGRAADRSFSPDQLRLMATAAELRRRFDLRPASDDAVRTHLFLVDLQKDFCFPEGALFVGGRSGRGAIDDNDRIARFIYRNLHRLTEVTCTLDTHFPHQVFFPSFWLEPGGEAPPPHRTVTLDDLRSGRLRPNPALAGWLHGGDQEWVERQVEYYCAELERRGRYTLYLWPPHCLLGSDGHALAGVIQEARLIHAWARGARSWLEVKGTHPLTESYSALAPEVLLSHDGRPLAERAERLVEILLEADAVLVAGQAASHCVKSTLDDLVEVATARDPALLGKVYVLADCTSAVTVPDPDRPGELLVDFTDDAEAALKRFADAGLRVVRSADPMDSWPGM